MRIAVVSNYSWLISRKNYGTLFQAFALQRALKERGHDVFLVKDGSVAFARGSFLVALRYRCGRILRALGLIGDCGAAKRVAYERKHPRNFEEFIDRNIELSSKFYDRFSIKSRFPLADAYISGSDQVWGAVDDLKFLNFAPEKKILRIAYAASGPWSALGSDWFDYARGVLKNFTAISVREREGLECCARAGIPGAKLVCDPTLLLGAGDYRSLIRKYNCDVTYPKPFILVYLVNVSGFKSPDFSKIKNALGSDYDIKVVAVQGCECAELPEEYLEYPTPAQWLNLFDKADYVLTNSFHGTMFSQIFKKNFTVLKQSGKTAAENCRFVSALSKLGLLDRILSTDDADEILSVMRRQIDWNSVDRALGEFVRESNAFLDEALKV